MAVSVAPLHARVATSAERAGSTAQQNLSGEGEGEGVRERGARLCVQLGVVLEPADGFEASADEAARDALDTHGRVGLLPHLESERLKRDDLIDAKDALCSSERRSNGRSQ